MRRTVGRWLALGATVSLSLSLSLPAQHTLPSRDPLVDRVLGEHRLHPELMITLAAREPLVVDPVDIEFDEAGRAFVLEMRGYPIVAEGEEPPGRIVELFDRDRDGTFEDREIFAAGFRYADSILPYRGGLLVADAPDLIFVRDSDGDGRADERRVLLTGFALGPSESLFNGLRFGPDGWVHGANGSSGGEVHFPGRPDEPISIRGQDFRFRFHEEADGQWHGEFEATDRMGGGFGLDFDDWGRKLVTHEQRHVQTVVVPTRYLPPGHRWPRTTVEISDHGQEEATRIYPISVTEERPNHPEQAGYFTAGCGLVHYGGGAFPEEFDGNVFVAEAVHNLVHRDVISADGAGFVARRAPGEERSEVLAAKDNAFRPVNMTVGPDGALWLLDIHRAVIEHPEWIPDEMEAELDVRAGSDRGRVYRITRKPGIPMPPFGLRRDDVEGLVRGLEQRNQWWRATARRLLSEQRTVEAVPALRALVRESDEPRARVEALWALADLGELDGLTVERALDDPDPRVREVALVESEPWLGRSRVAFERALAHTRDEDPRLRMQALLSLGTAVESLEAELVERLEEAAVRVALQDAEDRWLRLAVATVAARRPTTIVMTLLEAEPSPGRSELVRDLARIVGERAQPEELAALIDALEPVPVEVEAIALAGLAEGVESSQPELDEPLRMALAVRLTELESEDARLVLPSWRLGRALGLSLTPLQRSRALEAARLAADRQQPEAARLHALELVEFADPPGRLDLLIDLLSVREPPAVQRAAVEQLGRVDGTEPGARLIEVWPSLAPATRERAGDVLLYRRENHPQLLDALESGRILVGQLELDLERRRTLLRWSTPEVGERAARLFSDAGVRTRAEAYEAMKPALELTGDAEAGRRHYVELCARCHSLGEVGERVGPDLTDVFRKSAAALLHDIVDPNAAVSPEYLAYDVLTTDGELVSGLLVDDAPDALRLRMAAGEERRIPRDRVEEVRASGLSLMPEEMEVDLSPQQMADLLAWLQQPR